LLKRLKRALVESFVGAIALGWLFAQSAVHFAYVFALPVVNWLGSSTYRRFANQAAPLTFSLRDGLPELTRSLSLLVVGYVLLRWLYFTPIEQEVTPNPAESE
jgi:hypothetical protein